MRVCYMCLSIDHVCVAEYRRVSKKCIEGAAAAGKGAGREWTEAEAASSSGEATTTKAEPTSRLTQVKY